MINEAGSVVSSWSAVGGGGGLWTGAGIGLDIELVVVVESVDGTLIPAPPPLGGEAGATGG